MGISHSISVFIDLASTICQGYLLRKSFRRDILRGYLEDSAFVFMDLEGKRIFFGIYPILISKLPNDVCYS
jgi:hypothetical protein